MTPEEFERAGKKLFGEKWKPPMARALGIDPTMVWRYQTGGTAIPGPVRAAVKCWLQALRTTGKKPLPIDGD